MATVVATPAPDRQIRGAARHGIANLGGVAAAALSGFALNIVLTRGWPKEEVGLFFSATSAFLIAYAVARLGTAIGAVYFVSRYRTLGQPERIRPVLLAGGVPVLVLGTLIGLAGWISAADVARLIGAPGQLDLIRVLAVFVPFGALGDFLYAAGRGFGNMRPLLLVERLGRNGLQFAAVAVAAWLGLSVTVGLPLAWAMPYVPATAVALVWVAVLTRRASPAASSVRAELGPFWRYTAPRTLGSLAQMVIQRLSIVLVGAIRGLGEAAVYTAATRFLALGQLSGQAVSAAVQHRLAESFTRDDRAGAMRLYQAATGWLVLLAWPVYLLFALFADAVLALFGPGYATGRAVTVVLALTMLVATGCGMVDQVLNMAGKTAWTFYNALSAAVVNVGLNLLLIPRWGMLGAAVAWAAAIAAQNLVPLAQLAVAMRLHPFGAGTLTAAALALLCFAVPGLVARLVLGDNLVVLAAIAVAGALAYAAGAWRFQRVLQLDGLRKRGRR